MAIHGATTIRSPRRQPTLTGVMSVPPTCAGATIPDTPIQTNTRRTTSANIVDTCAGREDSLRASRDPSRRREQKTEGGSGFAATPLHSATRSSRPIMFRAYVRFWQKAYACTVIVPFGAAWVTTAAATQDWPDGNDALSAPPAPCVRPT